MGPRRSNVTSWGYSTKFYRGRLFPKFQDFFLKILTDLAILIYRKFSSSILPFADEEGGGCVLLLFADFIAGSPEVGGFLSVFSFSLESGAAAFEDLEDLLGVALFPSDPPKRSDSISSSP